uniref:Uncharacterized protein n=1 Tax=Oryza glumipatula TaxID=40148 RepID=A0A0E0BHG0_9ORYZ
MEDLATHPLHAFLLLAIPHLPLTTAVSAPVRSPTAPSPPKTLVKGWKELIRAGMRSSRPLPFFLNGSVLVSPPLLGVLSLDIVTVRREPTEQTWWHLALLPELHRSSPSSAAQPQLRGSLTRPKQTPAPGSPPPPHNPILHASSMSPSHGSSSPLQGGLVGSGCDARFLISSSPIPPFSSYIHLITICENFAAAAARTPRLIHKRPAAVVTSALNQPSQLL